MGTTSQKLQYLTTTKSNIKDAINLTGANILSEDTFRSYADKLKQGLVDAINDGGSTIYSNFPKTTGTGTEIALNDTYEAPMEIGLNGNTEQTTYTGKNLFDISTQENSNINVSTGEITPYNNFWRLSDYIEVNSNTKYTISWVNETNAASYIKVAYYDSNKTFVSGVSSGLVDYIDSYEITTPANINYIRFAYLVIVNNISAPKNNVQLEQGSKTSYEPFVGGIPSPSPDFPQPIEVVTGDNTINVHGKNLAKSYVNGESLNRYQPSLYVDADFEVGKKYAISFVDKSVGNSYYRNEYLMQNFPLYSITATGERQTYYFECKSNDKTDSSVYVEGKGFNIFKNYTVLSALPKFEDIQIEEVTSYDIPSTPYVPYQSKDYEINLKSKNLFDKNTMTMTNTFVNPEIGSSNGFTSIYTPCTPNTTYTISKAQETSRFYVGTTETLPTVGMTATVVSSSATGTTKTFTTGANANYIVAMVRSNNDTLTEEQIVAGIQIEENSTATEYEEFYDYKLCKINDYKDKIDKSTGKNLFNKDGAFRQGFLGDTGDVVYTAQSVSAIDYIPVEQNKKYICSYDVIVNGTQLRGIAFYDENKNYISRVTGVSSIIITPNNCKFMRVYFYNQNNMSVEQFPSYIQNIQIEQNSQATDYEPYGEQWYIKKNIGKVVLDGSENWQYYSVTQGSLFRSNNTITDEVNDATYVPYSNYYKGLSQNQSGSRTNNTFYINNFSSVVDIIDNRYTTINDFTNMLESNTIYIYYVLATPTYEIITNETLINQLEELEKAKSVENKTIISQTNADLPFIISASALSKN